MLRRIVSAAISFATFLVGVSALAASNVNLWLNVPFVPQQWNGCGAASVAMVMQYWEQHEGQATQVNADPARIFSDLYSRKAHGVYASGMVSYFQRNGFRAFAFAGNPADLEHQLALGRPLIAALKPGAEPSLHYVVVVGLDEPQNLVLVNDPAQRKLLKEDRSQFEREWKATGNWILLAVPETSKN